MLQLCTLGGASLHRADGSAIAVQRRPLALLAFVASAGSRGTTREKTLAIFWPDDEDERARHSLAQTLYALRRACGSDVIEGAATLRIDASTIGTDIGDLAAALAAHDPERAASLYTGAFLDGFHLPNSGEFERWLESERARLHHAVARALESCARRAADRGDKTDAASYWRKLSALDPLDGRVALAFVQSLAVIGDTAGAFRQAQLHQTLRRSELGLPPEAALTDFVATLRAQSQASARASAQAAGTGSNIAVTHSRAHSVPETASQSDAATTDRLSQSETRPGRRHVLLWSGGIAAALVMFLAARWLQSRHMSALDNRRVVVAVFQNQTSDTTLAPLGDMAADWISSELARTGLVDVVDSRAVLSAESERAASKDLPSAAHVRELARSVGAGIVVWGTYYRYADSLEFHAHVTDVRDGALLREMPPVRVPARDPMIALQKLASRVMGALATIENPRLAEWAVRGGTPPAYDAYREFVDGLQYHVHMDAVDALVHYKRARQIDPTFLQPLLFASDAENMLGNSALEESMLDSLKNRRNDLTPADRDLLDFQLAQSHGEPDRAYDAANDMARRSPSSESFVIAAQAALYVRRPGEALAWLERVDPNKGWVKGWVEYWMEAVTSAHMVGNDMEALRLAREARRASPDQLATYLTMTVPLAATGHTAAVLAEMDSASSATGHDGWRYDEALNFAASELAVHGYRAAAQKLWTRAIAWYDARPRNVSWPPDMLDTEVRILVRVGRASDAERIARSLVTAHPGNPTYIGTLGVAECAAGDSSGARAAAASLAGLDARATPADGGARGAIARARSRVFAALSDSAAAVSSLQQAMTDETMWIFHLRHEVVYHALQGYAPFRELEQARG